MPVKKYVIDSIDGGIQSAYNDAEPSQYLAGLGIDPDLPYRSSLAKTGGILTPVAYSKFSGTEIDGYPLWIVTQPKTQNAFVYTTAGKLHSFDSVLAMRATDEASTALPITITGGAGNGMVYYNNFIYLAENADISQYGGMDQGASIAKTENVWTGAKFGKTALTNTTYPTIRGTALPNHVMHLHTDNAVYVCDVLPTSGSTSGQGVIHKIKTTRTTIDGDTNDGSIYNALDLPYGFLPTDIETAPDGTSLMISAIQSTGASIDQGSACVFIWDTISDSFFHQFWMPDPFVTAMKNVNGVVYIFSGNNNAGARASAYLGGQTAEQIMFFEEGVSPFAGAVDAYGDRVSFGAYTTYPETTASVFAFGSKDPRRPKALHNIARASTQGTTPIVTALKYVQQASGITPRFAMGWGDDSNKGLDKLDGGGTHLSVFRKRFKIGRKFSIREISIPLVTSVSSGAIINVKIYVDAETTSFTLNAINNTNYSGKTRVVYKRPALTARGEHDFILELAWGGTDPKRVSLPIEIYVDEYDEESTA